MKVFVIISLLLCSFGSLPTSSNVYVCISPHGKKYHFNRECSGLKKCTHEIRRVSKDEAIRMRYTVCLLELK